jgi:hypothetical protein
MTTNDTATASSQAPFRVADLTLMTQGDERWARRQPIWRERELALAWPLDLLENFSLSMAKHGMSISRALMMCDRSYAVQQLTHAQTMDDPCLCDMAVQLFTHYEARPAGIRALH